MYLVRILYTGMRWVCLIDIVTRETLTNEFRML